MKKLLATIALGAAIISTPALAQEGGRMMQDQTRAQAKEQADELFQRFDLNHDGVVTVAERQQARAILKAERAGKAPGAPQPAPQMAPPPPPGQ